MTIRPILLHPDPRLKKIAAPVETIDDAVVSLAEDMLETMYEAPGIGLAAPQIGLNIRMFVMDCAIRADEGGDTPPPAEPMVLINPEILAVSDETNVYEEGCLSIPDQFAEVTRPSEVEMRWVDQHGKEHTRAFDGLWATCAQHELDHLNGKLFIDHISAIKRSMITTKMKKLKRERARSA